MRINSEADFDALARAAKLLAVASAWTELGLWDALAAADGPVDLAEVSGDTRALTITAPLLAHAGLLDGGGRHWRLSAVARAMHGRGELPTERNLGWIGDLTRTPQVLRDGGPVRGPDGESKATSGGVRPNDRAATRTFLDMLYRRSEAAAEQLADWIGPRLASGAHVLDVGGGHGRYAEAFTRRGFRATLFDMPMVVELARERHGDVLSYRGGNFHDDAFGGPYDAAMLSNIVHGESREANADLVRRVSTALAPGGLLVLKDMFIDEQGRDPEHAVFFGATMLFYTVGGQSYTMRDVADWCTAAGLGPTESIAVGTASLVLARKS